MTTMRTPVAGGILMMCLLTYPLHAQESPCFPGDQTLFSCSLHTHAAVALCRTPTTIQVVRQHPDRSRGVQDAGDIQQSITPSGAHGANIITRVVLPTHTITVFADTNPYDMAVPVVVTTDGSHVHTEYCAGPPTVHPAIVGTRLSSLMTLQRLGLAVQMQDPPEWPDDPMSGGPAKD